MQRILYSLILSFLLSFSTFAQNKFPVVVLETTKGIIKIKLYDSTIHHSENFVKLINEGYYNGQLFHRVIKNFMIQSGDDASINAKPSTLLGNGGKEYTLQAEFVASYFHKKGVIAAARESDDVNPSKASSGSQFYIVQGQILTPEQLDFLVKNGKHLPFTEEEIKYYTTIGGTPHLDTNYTVFGEVIEGLSVIEAISIVPTDANDRPLEDIKILKSYTLQ
jgi:cyclophilin family peptidyl-prolyl cis-trans isomerase